MTVEVLHPHGFCAGVTAALKKALSLAGRSNGAVYCLHELVHNQIVVEGLRAKGFVFVEDIAEIPPDATVLFSAHGVSPKVRELAVQHGLEIVDATCPFVTRVHKAARDFVQRGLPVVVLGHSGHAEARGIVGEIESLGGMCQCTADAQSVSFPDGAKIGVVSQTTMNADDVAFSVEKLRMRYDVETMAEVCNATKERQDAVKSFDGDAVLVLGSANSSNTRRLCEVARCRTFRAGTLDEVRALDLSSIDRLGVTSGASTPEDFFNEVISELEKMP